MDFEHPKRPAIALQDDVHGSVNAVLDEKFRGAESLLVFKLIFYSVNSQAIERTFKSALEKRLGTTFCISAEIEIRFRRPDGRWAAGQLRRRAARGLQQGVARNAA